MFHKLQRSVSRTRASIWKVFAMSTLLAGGNMSAGGTVLFDDFDRFSATAESLVLGDDRARTLFTSVGLQNTLTDTSVRTLLQAVQGSVGALIRWDTRQPAPNGYFGLIGADGIALLGWAGGDWPVLRETATGLHAANEDIVLQLEAIGNTINLWTWADGQPMPDMPTLTVVDDVVAAGAVGLGGMSNEYPNRGPVEAAFRYVHVASTHIPEPANAVLAANVFATVLLNLGRAAWHSPSRRLAVGRPATSRPLR
jgi:hypothetical protein